MADQSDSRTGPTPGDWQVGVHPVRVDLHIVKPVMMGDRIIKMPECEGGHAGFRNPADARLLAASKDMYEALRQAVDYSAQAHEPDEPWWMREARAALAKADGREGGDHE